MIAPATPAPAPLPWPFGRLTPEQRSAIEEQRQALERGELRRIPTVFGGLDEVGA